MVCTFGLLFASRQAGCLIDYDWVVEEWHDSRVRQACTYDSVCEDRSHLECIHVDMVHAGSQYA